jgi:dihydrodipicolinate synthase/N-acetylneuraminate lyase
MNREAIRERLRGPIPSVRTPFTREGAIDFPGLRRIVESLLDNGALALLLTYGDSLYSLLTDDEVVEVTQAVIEAAEGRALVVAADRGWATPKCVEFAAFCREAGADALMAMPPDWGASCTPETLTAHYAAAAQEIPVMLVSNVFVPRGLAFAIETIERVRDSVTNVVAIKDDWCEEFGRRLGGLVLGRWAVLAGGQKQYHLNALPYGCDGYLSTFLTFHPALTWGYWEAVTRGDLMTAAAIIRDYDRPFFDYLLGLPGGFDAGLRGILELAGLAERWRRPPYYSLSDAEMADLAAFLQERNLL